MYAAFVIEQGLNECKIFNNSGFQNEAKPKPASKPRNIEEASLAQSFFLKNRNAFVKAALQCSIQDRCGKEIRVL